MSIFGRRAGYSSMEIKGFKEIEQKLKDYPLKVKKRIIKPAIRSGITVIKDSIYSRAPIESGELKRTIRIRVFREETWGIKAVAIVDPRIKRAVNRRNIKGGRTNSYAAFVEYGTRKQKPKKFAREGFETTKEQALNTIVNAFRANFSKAVK
jgi:HK97 gp10 family phage protein